MTIIIAICGYVKLLFLSPCKHLMHRNVIKIIKWQGNQTAIVKFKQFDLVAIAQENGHN